MCPPDDHRPAAVGDLYEADFHAWSAAQAAALRRLAGLAGTGGVDWDNLIDEVESLGRSERQAVESLIRQIFIHLLKLIAAPDSPDANHWRGEIDGFLFQIHQKFCPSMRRVIEPAIASLWCGARQNLHTRRQLVPGPDACPLTLDDLLTAAAQNTAIDDLLARLDPPR